MLRSFVRLASGTRIMATEVLDGVCVLRVQDEVASITLNHAAKRNALGRDMVSALADHVLALRDDKSVRALVIASVEGSSVFSSGHNLVELSSMDRSQQDELLRSSTRMMIELQHLPFPVICQIDGLAAAAGAQLMAHCDMVYCTTSSTFSTPGVRYGFFCTTPGTALYHQSTKHAKMLNHMLFTGDEISSAEALRIGLVSHVFDDLGAMRQFTDKTLARVKELPRTVLGMGKLAILRQAQMLSHTTAMNFATDIMLDNLGHESIEEGFSAFTQKRKPDFRKLARKD